MTEEEAKTKWCPFTRVGSAAINRFDDRTGSSAVNAQTRCIASECMAWRWRHLGEGRCGLADDIHGYPTS